jgi:glucose-6-phosphate isomerase
VLNKTKSWSKIKVLGKKSDDFNLAKMFKKNPNRGKDLILSVGDLNFDFSKSRITEKVLKEFHKLAVEIGLQNKVNSMFGGENINSSQNRQVGHIWLRSKNLRPKTINRIEENQDQFLSFADNVRSGSVKGTTGKEITDVVNIGIGGSDLGPAMVYKALQNNHDNKINCHFLSNIDEFENINTFGGLNPETTLIVVTSKSFTTAETMKNALFAKNWLKKSSSPLSVRDHFVAVSTNLQACEEFGISKDRVFLFWDWVGGRYSLFSSVGISIALGYGSKAFLELQNGASKIDQSLKDINFLNFAPFIHAVINIWNLNILKMKSLAVIPYSSSLQIFPAFLQQLWMESNGKSIDLKGKEISFNTCPVIFGEPGTNSQHSFFQFLHQSPEIVPVDFILIKSQKNEDAEFQNTLFANALAQAAVLAFGKSKSDLKKEGVSKDLISHKFMPGNRPSNILILPQLNADSLGQLIAFYETSVILQGFLMNINSFDQWGVELGKTTAESFLNSIQGEVKLDFDSSTNNLISEFKKANP